MSKRSRLEKNLILGLSMSCLAGSALASTSEIKAASSPSVVSAKFPYGAEPQGDVSRIGDAKTKYTTPESMLGSWAMQAAVKSDRASGQLPAMFSQAGSVLYGVGTAAIGDSLHLPNCSGGCNQLNGTCYALQFSKINDGKDIPVPNPHYMIVQSVNVGASQGTFDIYMAGGGAGAMKDKPNCPVFWEHPNDLSNANTINWANNIKDATGSDRCKAYFNNFSSLKSAYNVTYNGVSHAANQTLINACYAASKSGYNADNFDVKAVAVTCPSALTQVSGLRLQPGYAQKNLHIHVTPLAKLTPEMFSDPQTAIVPVHEDYMHKKTLWSTQMQDCQVPSSGWRGNSQGTVANYQSSISADLKAPYLGNVVPPTSSGQITIQVSLPSNQQDKQPTVTIMNADLVNDDNQQHISGDCQNSRCVFDNLPAGHYEFTASAKASLSAPQQSIQYFTDSVKTDASISLAKDQKISKTITASLFSTTYQTTLGYQVHGVPFGAVTQSPTVSFTPDAQDKYNSEQQCQLSQTSALTQCSLINTQLASASGAVNFTVSAPSKNFQLASGDTYHFDQYSTGGQTAALKISTGVAQPNRLTANFKQVSTTSSVKYHVVNASQSPCANPSQALQVELQHDGQAIMVKPDPSLNQDGVAANLSTGLGYDVTVSHVPTACQADYTQHIVAGQQATETITLSAKQPAPSQACSASQSIQLRQGWNGCQVNFSLTNNSQTKVLRHIVLSFSGVPGFNWSIVKPMTGQMNSTVTPVSDTLPSGQYYFILQPGQTVDGAKQGIGFVVDGESCQALNSMKISCSGQQG